MIMNQSFTTTICLPLRRTLLRSGILFGMVQHSLLFSRLFNCCGDAKISTFNNNFHQRFTCKLK